MKERPGFMLYFELVDALSTMDDAEAGALFKALMAYAQWGEVRELTGVADFAFRIARPRIDKDAERYAERCLKNTYNAYVGAARRLGEELMEYEDWKEANAGDRMPTTTTTAAATATATAAAAPTAETNQNKNIFSKTKRGNVAVPVQDTDTAWVAEFLEQERKRNAKR